MFVDPNVNSDDTEFPPSDVTFLFKNEQQEIVGEIKAHKVILAFASDVFRLAFFGNFESENAVEIKDSSKEVFELFVAYIYNKQPNWNAINLKVVSSLYYLSDKYNVKTLKDELISSIPGHEINKNMVLEVAMLAQENLHFTDLSNALFFHAASCLRTEFGDKSQRVYEFYTGLSETHALVVFKLMSLMMSVTNQSCLNCKNQMANCLDGLGITPDNFVPGAKFKINLKNLPAKLGNVWILVEKIGTNGFIGKSLNEKHVESLTLRPDYYTYDCK